MGPAYMNIQRSKEEHNEMNPDLERYIVTVPRIGIWALVNLHDIHVQSVRSRWAGLVPGCPYDQLQRPNAIQ